jgi:hypothetical protein
MLARLPYFLQEAQWQPTSTSKFDGGTGGNTAGGWDLAANKCA